MADSDRESPDRPKLADQVPGSLGWRLVVAGFAHTFFNPLGSDRAANAELIGKPFTDEAFDAWNVADFMKYIQKLGLQPGDATAAPRLLAAMERAGLLMPAGWDPSFPLHGQRYISQGVLSAQNRGYLWLSEVIGPDLIIQAYKAVTVQVSAVDSPHWGSGLVLDESHIITNKHVVRRLAGYHMQIVAPVFGGASESSTSQQLRVLEHPDLDVAVIQLETPDDRGLTPLPGMVFRDPAWADDVYVLGYPSVSWMVNTGITLQRGEVVKPLAEVPRIREADADPWDTPDRTKMFLYSAIARPGNSGGPIVAHDGRVIGIVVQDSSLTSSSGENSADIKAMKLRSLRRYRLLRRSTVAFQPVK
jgi:hypothetical protein